MTPSGPATALSTPIVIRHGGLDRAYTLRVSDRRTSERPLVIEVHDRGISAGQFDRMTGLGSLAHEAGFALAMPAAIDEVWNDGREPRPGRGLPDDVAFLHTVIEDVASRVPVDRRRVYVVGSNGATMAGRLACERPEGIAAIAQVGGTAALAVAERCRPAGPLPVLQVHGTADPYARYARALA